MQKDRGLDSIAPPRARRIAAAAPRVWTSRPTRYTTVVDLVLGWTGAPTSSINSEDKEEF